MDNAFYAGRMVPINYTANEDEIIAITNLQAHGRIILTSLYVPNNKFGLTQSNYQTRCMDKSKLLFNFHSPSGKYVYNSEHPLTLSGVLNYHRYPSELPETLLCPS